MNSSYSSYRSGAIYPILPIILVQNSNLGKELNPFCPPSSSDDLCLLFCLYPSSMPGWPGGAQGGGFRVNSKQASKRDHWTNKLFTLSQAGYIVGWSYIEFFCDFRKRALYMLPIRYIFMSPIKKNRQIWPRAAKFSLSKNHRGLKNVHFFSSFCALKNAKEPTLCQVQPETWNQCKNKNLILPILGSSQHFWRPCSKLISIISTKNCGFGVL